MWRIFYLNRSVKALWLTLLLCVVNSALAAEVVWLEKGKSPVLDSFYQLAHSGLLFKTPQGAILYSKDADVSFIPASTTKLITALLALRHWGEDYRFKTGFYLKNRANLSEEGLQAGGGKNFSPPVLLIKGHGDPFLVSEELAFMAKQLAKRLKQQHITALAGIQLDVSYYQGGVIFPGASQTDNPYDAVSSALAANFNTLYFRKIDNGFESAEPQTPMTKTALALAEEAHRFKKTPRGLEKRINLGQDEVVAQRYFAELFAAFLRQEGIQVSESIAWQTVGHRDERIYEHHNQRTLADMIRPMLKYSTNFIANQLALNLSQALLGGAACAEKVAKVYQQQLQALFHWESFTIEEGAGLSRENRLSPKQLVDVLKAFAPWRHLLPEIEPNVYAKSGSLQAVSTLAGYVHHDTRWYPFVFMMNQTVPYGYRNRLARELEVILNESFF